MRTQNDNSTKKWKPPKTIKPLSLSLPPSPFRPSHLNVGKGKVEISRISELFIAVKSHAGDTRHDRIIHALRQVLHPLLIHIHLFLRHLVRLVFARRRRKKKLLFRFPPLCVGLDSSINIYSAPPPPVILFCVLMLFSWWRCARGRAGGGGERNHWIFWHERLTEYFYTLKNKVKTLPVTHQDSHLKIIPLATVIVEL